MKNLKIAFSVFISIVSAAIAVFLTTLDFFSEINLFIKAIVVLFSVSLVTIIYIALWYNYSKTKNESVSAEMLPMLSCIQCEDLLCCLQAIRPIVLTTNGVQNILSLSGKDKEGSALTDEFALASYEATVKRKVWIASPDLSYVCKDTNFTNVVKNNLCNRKIEYVFFAIDSSQSRQNANKLYSKYKTFRNKNRIKFYLMNESEFKLTLHLYNFVVYDPIPNEKKGIRSTAYVCVGENDKSVRSIYKELNEKNTNTAIQIFTKIQSNKNMRYKPRMSN
jgi:hypothetical protein